MISWCLYQKGQKYTIAELGFSFFWKSSLYAEGIQSAHSISVSDKFRNSERQVEIR